MSLFPAGAQDRGDSNFLNQVGWLLHLDKCHLFLRLHVTFSLSGVHARVTDTFLTEYVSYLVRTNIILS